MIERSRDDLERARAKWWATVSSGDLDGYVSLFADDAVWVTPELDEIVGRDAIRAWLEPVFDQFDYELTITVADVRVAGDLGIERARFVSRMTPKPLSPAAPAPPPAPAPLPPRDWVPGDEQVVGGAPEAEPGEPTDAPLDAPSGISPDATPAPEGDAAEPAEGDAEVEGEAEATGEVEGGAGIAGEATEPDEVETDDVEAEPVAAPLLADPAGGGDHEPHEGRYLMYWRWHDDGGWLVQRYADVTGVG